MHDPKIDTQTVNTTLVFESLFDTLRKYSQSSKMSAEDILRQRARQYAETDAQAAISEDTLGLLSFTIDDTLYGLNVMRVQTVRDMPPITRVPNAPEFYRGVVNVRGVVMTLFDLHAFFGLGHTENIRELVVVEAPPLVLGMAVTRIHEVYTVPRSAINALEDLRYALGAYVSAAGRMVILDADELFSDDRLNTSPPRE